MQDALVVFVVADKVWGRVKGNREEKIGGARVAGIGAIGSYEVVEVSGEVAAICLAEEQLTPRRPAEPGTKRADHHRRELQKIERAGKTGPENHELRTRRLRRRCRNERKVRGSLWKLRRAPSRVRGLKRVGNDRSRATIADKIQLWFEVNAHF